MWLGDAVTIASILSLVASVLAASVKPPSASAPGWVAVAYRIATWPALNLAWAQNAVVPGAHAPVQRAMLVTAKLAHAAPELAAIVEQPAIKGAVLPVAVSAPAAA